MVRYLYQTQHSQPRVIAVLLLISDFLKYDLSFCTSAQYTRFTCFCVRPRVCLAGQCHLSQSECLYLSHAFPFSVITGKKASGGPFSARTTIYGVRSPTYRPYPGENGVSVRRTHPALTAVFFRNMVYIHKPENDTDPLSGFFGWSAAVRQAKMDLSRTDVAA